SHLDLHSFPTRRSSDLLSATGRRLTYFEEILSFIEGSIRTHRAHHYMLILSGHGHGSVGDFLSEGQANKIQGLSIPSLGKLIERSEEHTSELQSPCNIV